MENVASMSPGWYAARQAVGAEGRTGPHTWVHPTQLHEMVAAIVLGGLSVWLLLRRERGGGSSGADAVPRTPPGVPFLAFALGFTLFRLGNHFLRARLPTISTPLWFYPV